MNEDRGVLGLYTDELIGMDHPIFMARMEARVSGAWGARDGRSLDETLASARRRITWLFGDMPLALVDATVTTAWLEAQGREKEDGDE